MSPTTLVCTLAALALPALAADETAAIPISLAQTQTFGMVGLAPGQTARVNLLNPGSPSPSPLATGNPTGPTCAAQVDFFDDQGFLLKTQVLTISPGKSLSVDLDHDELASPHNRSEIRVNIHIPPQAGGIVSPQFVGCGLLPTFEIFDHSDSKTVLLIIGNRFSYGPVPLVASAAVSP
jgi:hypothetical protein